MGRVRASLSVSVDGYLAGPGQSAEQPLGAGGQALHEWVVGTRAWRDQHDLDGVEETVDDRVAAEHLVGVGATVMGRRMFGGEVPWGDDPWTGWWGDSPPFHHPVFVLTSHARPPLRMEGGTTFHFVTEGPEAALAMAREAAGAERDVSIGGGARTARWYLDAGLVDVLDLHVAPVLLGDGSRLLGDLPTLPEAYRPERVLQGDRVMHVRWLRSG